MIYTQPVKALAKQISFGFHIISDSGLNIFYFILSIS